MLQIKGGANRVFIYYSGSYCQDMLCALGCHELWRQLKPGFAQEFDLRMAVDSARAQPVGLFKERALKKAHGARSLPVCSFLAVVGRAAASFEERGGSEKRKARKEERIDSSHYSFLNPLSCGWLRRRAPPFRRGMDRGARRTPPRSRSAKPLAVVSAWPAIHQEADVAGGPVDSLNANDKIVGAVSACHHG